MDMKQIDSTNKSKIILINIKSITEVLNNKLLII